MSHSATCPKMKMVAQIMRRSRVVRKGLAQSVTMAPGSARLMASPSTRRAGVAAAQAVPGDKRCDRRAPAPAVPQTVTSAVDAALPSCRGAASAATRTARTATPAPPEPRGPQRTRTLTGPDRRGAPRRQRRRFPRGWPLRCTPPCRACTSSRRRERGCRSQRYPAQPPARTAGHRQHVALARVDVRAQHLGVQAVRPGGPDRTVEELPGEGAVADRRGPDTSAVIFEPADHNALDACTSALPVRIAKDVELPPFLRSWRAVELSERSPGRSQGCLPRSPPFITDQL